MRLILQELGHPQPPTPCHVDNTTAVGIVNNTIKRQRSRSMEMRYFWLLAQWAQKNLQVVHHPGQENFGDYPSKHHTVVQYTYIVDHIIYTCLTLTNSPELLPRAAMPSSRQGCAETLGDPYHSKTQLPRIPNYREHTRTAVPVTAAAASAVSVQPSLVAVQLRLAKRTLCRVALLASAANSNTKITHTRIRALCS